MKECLTFQHNIKAFRGVFGFGVWGLVFGFLGFRVKGLGF